MQTRERGGDGIGAAERAPSPPEDVEAVGTPEAGGPETRGGVRRGSFRCAGGQRAKDRSWFREAGSVPGPRRLTRRARPRPTRSPPIPMGQCASQPRVDAPVDRKLTPSDSADSLARPNVRQTRGEAFYHPTKTAKAAPFAKPLPSNEGVVDDYTLRRGVVPRHMYTSQDVNNPAIPPVHPDHRLTKEEAEAHPLGRFLNASRLAKPPPNRWGPWEDNAMVKEVDKRLAELEAADPARLLYEKLMAERFEALKALPQRPIDPETGEINFDVDPTAEAASDEPVPTAPRALSSAMERALMECDDKWADKAEIAEMLHPDIVYRTMDGKTWTGRRAATDKMNHSIAQMTVRMKRSAKKSWDIVKWRDTWVATEPERKAPGVWVMEFRIKLLLMSIKFREEYVIDDRGRILELTRVRLS